MGLHVLSERREPALTTDIHLKKRLILFRFKLMSAKWKQQN